jgi:hypothetical protein
MQLESINPVDTYTKQRQFFGNHQSRNCEAQILNVTWQCNGEDAVYSSTLYTYIALQSTLIS